jgi:hypothetical protein
MALLDLGKFRFNWAGVWNASANYTKDDVVERNGASYIAVTNNFSRPPENFPADWDRMAQGFAYRGAWDAQRGYAMGDMVKYKNTIWVADQTQSWATGDADLTVPTTDPFNWSEVINSFNYAGDWDATTQYEKYDIVKYNDNLYLAASRPFSVGNAYGPTTSGWDELMNGYSVNSGQFGILDAQTQLTVNGGAGNSTGFEVNSTDIVVHGGGRYLGDDWGAGTVVNFERTYNGANRTTQTDRIYEEALPAYTYVSDANGLVVNIHYHGRARHDNGNMGFEMVVQYRDSTSTWTNLEEPRRHHNYIYDGGANWYIEASAWTSAYLDDRSNYLNASGELELRLYLYHTGGTTDDQLYLFSTVVEYWEVTR